MEVEQQLNEKWNKFLSELDKGSDSDKELKDYLEAIKYVSEININNILDNLPNNKRYEIENNIKTIVKFIEKYKEDYYEISQIKGFKSNESICGRDYYYYIANQKMKASVYYMRYLNFINNTFINKEEIIKKIKEIEVGLGKYDNEKNLKNCANNENDLVLKIKNLIHQVEELSDKHENRFTIRKNLYRYYIVFKSHKDINYIKYMLFNNMLHEIRYIGAAYQYLWHWESKKKTIYRYVSNADNEVETEFPKTKQEYLKKMFSDCISHMNCPSHIRHSYSEDPFLDIYKYVVIKEEAANSEKNELFKNEYVAIKSNSFENDNVSKFEIIKDADINGIFISGKYCTFYEYIQNIKIDSMNNLAYTVEIYPQSLIGEKNEKGTVKYMRDYFLPIYLSSLGVENTNLSKTKVADDKEVIAYGKFYKETIDLDNYSDKIKKFEEYEAGTCFKMTLSKDELIYIILKIGEKHKDEKIVDYISNNLLRRIQWDNEWHFRNAYLNQSDCVLELSCSINRGAKKNISFYVDVNKDKFKDSSFYEDGQPSTIDREKNLILKEAKKEIRKELQNRYESILKKYESKGYSKCNYILEILSKEKYNQNLYDKYSEIGIENEDGEISILKYFIFKR